MPSQVTNGKAFEYAIAFQYCSYLSDIGLSVNLIQDSAYLVAKQAYENCSDTAKKQFDTAASATIPTMVRIEPGLITQSGSDDILNIRIAHDSEGIHGDVRDIIFQRSHKNKQWEIGFSAKNNNDAVKHSRLSPSIDFGASWMNIPVSETYKEEIQPIFQFLSEQKASGSTWNDLGNDKITKVYVPLLNAFRKELLRIDSKNPNVPQKLVSYLIGEYPFYKIIKDDNYNIVVVKAYNINGVLNSSIGEIKPKYRTAPIFLPKRIVEFDFKGIHDDEEQSTNTLIMILDEGWTISFRIHNASSYVETSLKFDIKLLGNPPILFTQYLFTE